MASDSITPSWDGNTMELTFTEAVESAPIWHLGSDSGNAQCWFLRNSGVRLRKIKWTPSAANDILHIRRGDSGGVPLVYWKAADDTDQRIEYFDGDEKIKPYICPADQTITTEATIKLELILA